MSVRDRHGADVPVQVDKIEEFCTRADERRLTRANAGKDNLLKRRCNHEFRNRFFSSRVIDEWNGLPNEVKEANSATIFKRLYRRHRVGTVAPS